MSDENEKKVVRRRTIYPEGVAKRAVPLTLAEDEIDYLRAYVAPSGARAVRYIVRSYLAAEAAVWDTDDVSQMYDQELLALWQATLRIEARLEKLGQLTEKHQVEARRKQVEAEVLRRTRPAVQGGLVVNA
jgi:hypothetical protein